MLKQPLRLTSRLLPPLPMKLVILFISFFVSGGLMVVTLAFVEFAPLIGILLRLRLLPTPSLFLNLLHRQVQTGLDYLVITPSG